MLLRIVLFGLCNFCMKNVHAKQFKNPITPLNKSLKKSPMQEGNVVALLYKASEGHMWGLTFWLVGFLRFDPVEGVIHKEL